jgi:hypothetical protein
LRMRGCLARAPRTGNFFTLLTKLIRIWSRKARHSVAAPD